MPSTAPKDGPAIAKPTRTNDYPALASEKYGSALERVANVHARFQKELDAIGGEIGRQTALSADAVERYRQVGPRLEAMAGSIAAISEDASQVAGLVREGRSGLRLSVADVQQAIEDLRARNETMRTILDVSRKVTVSVAEIAEIAVENKLIAINASVTASKAGETVKGFKVIADEISKVSASMEDRVRIIADRARQVGESMREIMGKMDESIQSTQKALGNIDEAFRLLDGIDASVQATRAANGEMLAENATLIEKSRTLEGALSLIDANVKDAVRQADEIQATMRRQAANVQKIARLLPELRGICESIAGGGADEEPKILRLCESACVTYDPALTRMLREIHYVSFVGIRLLRYSSDKRLVPYLAETWFLHPDGKTWEFKLKGGAAFHDGSPVRSRDVKFSLERLLNPALGSPYANLFAIIEGADEFIAGRADSVSGIKILDAERLQFKLKDPFNFFLSLLALSFSTILKEDRSIYSRPIGRGEIVSAGPFRFAPSDSPEVDRLVRNERFVNGRPFLDGMEIRRDVADIPQAFSRGELDMAYNIPASSAGDFKRLGFGGELGYYTSRYCYGLIVNFTRNNYITRNADLRRALAAAIDKDEIVRDALEGKAIRADAVLPPESLDIGGRVFLPYDPDGAGRAIETCRKGEDLAAPIKIAFRGYSTIPNLPEIAERLSRMLTRLDLKVAASFHPASTPIAAFRDDYDLVFLGFLSELDLFSALEPFINPEGGDNYFGYRNPELFKLLNDSRTIKDNGERKEFFIEILRRLTQDVFMIPLFFKKSLLVRARHVHSIVLSAEESFYPDAVYLSSAAAAGPGGRDRGDARILVSYGEAVKRLCAETAIVAEASDALIRRGKDIGSAIALQRRAIGDADRAFSSFAESAAKVQAARVGVVERIRGTLEVTAKSGEAAGLILVGLRNLSAALEGTVKALDHVKDDTRHMLGVVLDIGKSNEFISSIAVNAAIIAAKADSRGGDLVKVSQSISRQARRNTENTDVIKGILEDMDKTAGEHLDFLGSLVSIIGLAADRVGKSGDILGRIGPVLSDVNDRCDVVEETSGGLADRIREAELSVDQINAEAEKLALDAETLQFGLDMEQAVTDILADVSDLGQGVCDFLLDPARRARA